MASTFLNFNQDLYEEAAASALHGNNTSLIEDNRDEDSYQQLRDEVRSRTRSTSAGITEANLSLEGIGSAWGARDPDSSSRGYRKNAGAHENLLGSERSARDPDGSSKGYRKDAGAHENLPGLERGARDPDGSSKGYRKNAGAHENLPGPERSSGGKETRSAWKQHQMNLWIDNVDPIGNDVTRVEPTDANVEVSAPSRTRSRASALRDFARLNKKSGQGRSLLFRAHRQWRSLVILVDHSLPILNPNTRNKIIWDLFIMTFVLFCAATVPLDISYGLPNTDDILNILNWSIDLVFAVDICINFRTAYYDHQGYLVRDSDRIAVNYMKFWFPIDLFATIPYDLLAMACGLSGGGVQTIVLQFLKTPRLLRLGRLVRILDRVKNVNWLKVVILVAGMICVSHWLACIWFMMYRFCTFPEGQSIYDWSFYLASEDGSLPAYYLSAYYQSFLMIVGNYQVPSNNAERVFFIIIGILGTCFYAAAVGQMSVLIANMAIVSLRHKQKRDMTMDVLRYAGVSAADQARVEGYFEYVTQYSHPTNEGMQFVYELPKALYQDIAGLLFKQSLIRMPFFKDLEDAFLNAVSLKMKIVTYTPKEVIFMAGDLGHEMYIIRKGSVAVVGGSHGELLSLLSTGDHFGEIAALTQQRRTAKCVALAHCDLCVLHSNDLRYVMKDFPASAMQLEAVLASRMKQLKVAGWAGFLDEDESFGGDEVAELEEEEEREPEDDLLLSKQRVAAVRAMSTVEEGEEGREEEDGSTSSVSSVDRDPSSDGSRDDDPERASPSPSPSGHKWTLIAHSSPSPSQQQESHEPTIVLSPRPPSPRPPPPPPLPPPHSSPAPTSSSTTRLTEDGLFGEDLDETLKLLRELSVHRAPSIARNQVRSRADLPSSSQPLGEATEEEQEGQKDELSPLPPLVASSTRIGSMGKRRAPPVIMSLTPQAALGNNTLPPLSALIAIGSNVSATSESLDQAHAVPKKETSLGKMDQKKARDLTQARLPSSTSFDKRRDLTQAKLPSSNSFDKRAFAEVLALVPVEEEEEEMKLGLVNEWGLPGNIKKSGRRGSVLMGDMANSLALANSSSRSSKNDRRSIDIPTVAATSEEAAKGPSRPLSGKDEANVAALIKAAVAEAVMQSSEAQSLEISHLKKLIEKQAAEIKAGADRAKAAEDKSRRIHQAALSLDALVRRLALKIDDMEGRMIETNKEVERIEEDQGDARMLKELRSRAGGGGGGILGTSLLKASASFGRQGPAAFASDDLFAGRSQGSQPALSRLPSLARNQGSVPHMARVTGSQSSNNVRLGGLKKPPGPGSMTNPSPSSSPATPSTLARISFNSPSFKRVESKRRDLPPDPEDGEKDSSSRRTSPLSALPRVHVSQ